MTVDAIPRTAWQDPAKPVIGPLRKQPFRQGVVHWEGAPTRLHTPADIAQHLRNIQADYLGSRGYSIGYGFAVVSDPTHPADGSRWQLRGTDLNMASNPGAKFNAQRTVKSNVNDWTGSILIIGPGNKNVSAKAAEAVRSIFSQWHYDSGTTPVNPWPHSATDYTTCCGPYYSADLAEGRFNPARMTAPAPAPTPATPTPATPTQGEDPNMLIALIRLEGTPAVYAQYSGGYKVWIRDGKVYDMYAWLSGKQVVDINNRALFEASGPIMGDRPAGVNTYGLPV